MIGQHASPGDMPTDLWTLSDEAMHALLTGQALATDQQEALRPTVTVLAALTASASSTELAHEARARAAFRANGGVAALPRPRWRQRSPWLTRVLRVKLVTLMGAGAIGLGSAAAAAYTGALPDSVQSLAHGTIGAPAPGHASHAGQPASSTPPVGPDPAGSSAFGLCTAYSNAQTHGNATAQAVAFNNLAVAAGGASKIPAYCSSVTRPGSPAAESSTPAHHPTSRPTPRPNGHGTGRPTSLPAPAQHAQAREIGKPTAMPTQAQGRQDHPTGKPSSNPGNGHRP
jgi:hypothetical protein